jgi:hypothetical protein
MSTPNNVSLQAERTSFLDKPFAPINGSAQEASSDAHARSAELREPHSRVSFLAVLLRALSAWPV